MGSGESIAASIGPNGDQETLLGSTTGESTSRLGPHGYVKHGTRIGRYLVLGTIGRGGMGVVYRAHDPQLDREVALKLLLDAKTGHQTRLAREARALAQLNHPNVVTVHDVGTEGGRLYLAMELVTGTTLEEWQRDRPWRDVVAVYIEAGRGLAAAHARSLVHRDFKPDNVIVTDDGIPRVLDFGLVRVSLDRESDGGEPYASASVDALSGSAPLDDKVTRVGAAVGTPAYMSPEQWCGLDAGPAADQYAFCASLYEGLFGRTPWAGTNLQTLREKVAGGEVPQIPARTGVPAWVQSIVRRGLAHDPQKRWPSMQHLLDALADDPSRRRRRWFALGGLVLVVVGALGTRAIWSRSQHQACVQEAAAIDEVWNDARRASLATFFADNPTGSASSLQALDRQAETYRQIAQESCLAVRLEGTRDAEDHARVTECLVGHRDAMLGVVTVADEPQASAHDTITTVLALEPFTDCTDLRRLRARPPTPRDDASGEALEEIRRMSARMLALRESAPPLALELARTALMKAQSLGWEPAVAAAQVALGETHYAQGHYADAKTHLREGFFAAATVGDDRGAAVAAVSLARLFAEESTASSGQHWVRLAQAHLERTELGDRLVRAQLLSAKAQLEVISGQLDEAQRSFTQALEFRRELLGDEHVVVAGSYQNLGALASQRGDYEAARAHHRTTMAIYRERLGPDHPRFARALANLANVADREGDRSGANKQRTRALEILERALGPDHPEIAQLLLSVGRGQLITGDFPQAHATFSRAVDIFERAFGPDNAKVGRALLRLGLTASMSGNPAEGVTLIERALTITEHQHGREHALTVEAMAALASALSAQGKPELARKRLLEAIAIGRGVLPPGHEKLGAMLLQLGQLLLDARRADAAVPVLEESLEILEATRGTDNSGIRFARELLTRAQTTAAGPPPVSGD